jgi:imidazolonepropionase-like amidohydrolase
VNERLLLRDARVLDGTGADPRQADILIVDGRFAAIGPGLSDRDATVIDAGGRTLLPGLIDAHSHLGIIHAIGPEDAPAVTAAHIFHNCELALDAGFTTVRDVGGIDGGVAQAVELGLIRGPRIFPSGPLLCQSGGHGDDAPPFSPDYHHHHYGIPGLTTVSMPCDGPDGVRLAARTALRRGATQLKVCVSGGVVSLTDSLEDSQFTVAELVAAVEEAHARRTYVTAHAHNIEGIRNGLEAGVECFEHGTFLDEPTAAAMAAAGACLVPTFAVLRIMREEWQAWSLPESVLPRLDGVEDAMARSLKLARAAGVTVGAGSDLLGTSQRRRGLELVIRAGLESAMDAIVASTSVNARIIRRDRDVGSIEIGKYGDLIAVDGDPLDDPALFDDPERVSLVVKAGEVEKNRL